MKIGVLGEVYSLAYAAETRFLAIGMGDQVHVTREHEQSKHTTIHSSCVVFSSNIQV